MDIFENLENLPISEECFNEIMDIVEEYIHEVSVKRWKQAAANSIEGRKQKRIDNEDDYYAFSGKIPGSMQAQLDREHTKRDDYHSDRVARAEYLTKNLPDSNKSASKVMSAAKKASETRTEKAEKLFKDAVDKYGQEGHNERAKDYNVTASRERHAREVANKPLIGGDGKPSTGKYLIQNADSYKEEHKRRNDNLEKAQKNLEKVLKKHVDKMGDDEFDPHREAIQQADREVTRAKNAIKNAHLSHKV